MTSESTQQKAPGVQPGADNKLYQGDPMSESIVTPVPRILRAEWASVTEMVGTIHDNTPTDRPSDPSGATFEHRLVVGSAPETRDADSVTVTIVQAWSINLGLISVSEPRIRLEGYDPDAGITPEQALALAEALAAAAPRLGLIVAAHDQNVEAR